MTRQANENAAKQDSPEAGGHCDRTNDDSCPDGSVRQKQLENKLCQLQECVASGFPCHTLIKSLIYGLEATRNSNDNKFEAALKELERAMKAFGESEAHALPPAGMGGISQAVLDETMQRNRELERQNAALQRQVNRHAWNNRLFTAEGKPYSEWNEELAHQPEELSNDFDSQWDNDTRGKATEASDSTQPDARIAKPASSTLERFHADGDKSIVMPQSSSGSYFDIIGDYEEEHGHNHCGERMTVLDDFSEYLPVNELTMNESSNRDEEVDASQDTGARFGSDVNCWADSVPDTPESIGQVLLKHPIQLCIGLFQIAAGIIVWKEMANLLVERNHWMDANGLSRLYLLQSLAYQRQCSTL